MNINKYFDNNVVFIIPNNYKTSILKIINNEKTLYNIKIYTINEIKKNNLFDYDEKSLLFLINKYSMTYSYAKDVLENLYFILFDENNPSFKYFVDIKNDLLENKLLYYNELFINNFKNKKCYVFGFNYIYKFEKKIIKLIEDITEVEYIEINKDYYNHNALMFHNINEEIEFVANNILDKINNGTNINNIYIANLNKNYLNTVKRIFSFYNIPINLIEKTSLYNITISHNLIYNLNNPQEYLNNICNIEIKNKCINLLNKYYFINDLTKINNIIIKELQNTYLSEPLYKEAVNLIDMRNDFITTEMEIFLIGAAAEYIPHIHKDEDLINDIIKPEYLEQTWEKNNIESIIWKEIITGNKNLTITFSKNTLKETLTISPLLSEMDKISMTYNISKYSNKSNVYNLGLMLDQNIKYGEIHEQLNALNYNYPNINYLKYNNNFDSINPDLIKKYLNNNINLSYTKLNSFYECGFKYYLEYILKLGTFEDKFEAFLGSLIHFILSKIYNDDFDFEKEKEIFIENNKFSLSNSNKLFLDKSSQDLKDSIEYILSFHKNSLYNEIECEKVFNLVKTYKDITINFTGIIDKILKNNNNIAIIDYKTGKTDFDLSIVNHGLKMQLLIYIYLVKNSYPESNITGIYLQNINRLIPNYDPKKNIVEMKKDSLKLVGYTIDNESIIEDFDHSYKDSDYIKSMSINSKGFSRYTKLLTEENFKTLSMMAEDFINKAAEEILNGNFDINPKIIDKKNMSCNFCDYKSICFVNNSNYQYFKSDKDLSFLGGNNHEMD